MTTVESAAQPLEVEEAGVELPYETTGARKVLIQQYDYAVRTLMDMIAEGDLLLDPDYQRYYRWTDEKASRFIESIALNIPVPVVYLAEESDGTFTVIDGQQRLTSLFRFLRPSELPAMFPNSDFNELVLTNLKVRSDLNGKRLVDLERAERSVLAKRPIRCIVVLNESDSTLKFEVFERLNTGSSSLTDQEVRNCIHRGSYNELIKKLAANVRFREMTALSESSRKSMKDAELVLRFFAYRELNDGSDYQDNYAEYLNSHMEMRREISTALTAELEALFNNTVNVIYETLGPGVAFRKPDDRLRFVQGTTFAHTMINGAIYESQMVAVSKLVAAGGAIPQDLKARICSAFSDDSYWNALFQGTSKRRERRSDRNRSYGAKRYWVKKPWSFECHQTFEEKSPRGRAYS